jgi:uncharacterized cupin superfamily protein
MRGYYKWVLIGLLFSIVSGAAAYYYMGAYLPKTINFDFKPKPSEVETKFEPYPEWDARERQRALAVVIDNTPQARPQSGLDQAEVVIEVPVEGGLTRLLAIMTGDGIETVGPIRSVRSYLVDLANEYSAILVHAGGEQETLNNLETDKAEHLDELFGGREVAAAFWRVSDRSKPHNLYASLDSLRRAAKAQKYKLSSAPVTRETLTSDATVDGEEVDDITIYYPNRESEVRYVYNKEELTFARFISGNSHNTAKGQQIKTPNIIIQFVPHQTVDGDGRLQLILHGEGKALVFREGKVVTARWKKTPGQFTRYTDLNGGKIPLLQGPTWIEIVTNATRVDY